MSCFPVYVGCRYSDLVRLAKILTSYHEKEIEEVKRSCKLQQKDILVVDSALVSTDLPQSSGIRVSNLFRNEVHDATDFILTLQFSEQIQPYQQTDVLKCSQGIISLQFEQQTRIPFDSILSRHAR